MGKTIETLTVIPEKVENQNQPMPMTGLFGSNQKSSILGEDPAAPTQFLSNNSNSVKMFSAGKTGTTSLPEQSTYAHSRLNLLDDLLQETYAQK